MTKLFIYILSVCFLTSSGQKEIDWKSLIGNWKIDRQVNFHNKDTTSPWLPEKKIIYSFDANQNFTFIASGDNTQYTGKYNTNKSKYKISFINLIQTTKFPGTSYKDFVGPAAPLPDVFVIKLNSDFLIFYQKGCDDAIDTNCGTVTYLSRTK